MYSLSLLHVPTEYSIYTSSLLAYCLCRQNIQYTLLPTATVDRIFNIHSYLLQLPTEYSIYTPTYCMCRQNNSIYTPTHCNCRQNIQYPPLPTATADRIFNIHPYLLQLPKEYSIYTPTYCNADRIFNIHSYLQQLPIEYSIYTPT